MSSSSKGGRTVQIYSPNQLVSEKPLLNKLWRAFNKACSKSLRNHTWREFQITAKTATFVVLYEKDACIAMCEVHTIDNTQYDCIVNVCKLDLSKSKVCSEMLSQYFKSHHFERRVTFIVVGTENGAAIRCYEKVGFKKCNIGLQVHNKNKYVHIMVKTNSLEQIKGILGTDKGAVFKQLKKDFGLKPTCAIENELVQQPEGCVVVFTDNRELRNDTYSAEEKLETKNIKYVTVDITVNDDVKKRLKEVTSWENSPSIWVPIDRAGDSTKATVCADYAFIGGNSKGPDPFSGGLKQWLSNDSDFPPTEDGDDSATEDGDDSATEDKEEAIDIDRGKIKAVIDSLSLQFSELSDFEIEIVIKKVKELLFKVQDEMFKNGITPPDLDEEDHKIRSTTVKLMKKNGYTVSRNENDTKKTKEFILKKGQDIVASERIKFPSGLDYFIRENMPQV